MDYHLILAGPAPDLASFDAALRDADPSALMDLDRTGRIVRLSTALDESEIGALLANGLSPLPAVRIERQPSNCCGGCGG